ncbi:hypothetical protein KK103_11860 [Curtobacterium flaccumfaciens pv. flaccumfaciens]|uniref:Uncharacterized protein n=1 Tax=Curtobacterium flaccumfaciens pv. flaccumfaciens TaxID=138532 RepID=A0A9Q2W7M8_9MICO|nr:hypothetical protein [Curtobacterium flaccumfaciens]MBT1542460.1 hypothetical protein [Curtobacterium flaccumfaciens pv. flaccumfaciens]
MTTLSTTQFRRGDTVRHRDIDYDMYVTATDAAGNVTTDAWSALNAADLELVRPVEDKYDVLMESVARGVKEAQR